MCAAGGDSDTVWYEHCSDTDTLARYAAAMHQLATDVWSRRDDTRIDWCRRACLDYFMGGGLQRLREKDERRRQHDANSDGVGDEMTVRTTGSQQLVEQSTGFVLIQCIMVIMVRHEIQTILNVFNNVSSVVYSDYR